MLDYKTIIDGIISIIDTSIDNGTLSFNDIAASMSNWKTATTIHGVPVYLLERWDSNRIIAYFNHVDVDVIRIEFVSKVNIHENDVLNKLLDVFPKKIVISYVNCFNDIDFNKIPDNRLTFAFRNDVQFSGCTCNTNDRQMFSGLRNSEAMFDECTITQAFFKHIPSIHCTFIRSTGIVNFEHMTDMDRISFSGNSTDHFPKSFNHVKNWLSSLEIDYMSSETQNKNNQLPCLTNMYQHIKRVENLVIRLTTDAAIPLLNFVIIRCDNLIIRSNNSLLNDCVKLLLNDNLEQTEMSVYEVQEEMIELGGSIYARF